MSTVNRDYIVRQIREFAECNEECGEKFYYGQGCSACGWGKIIEIVKNAPEEEVMEVVRCKDCRYYRDFYDELRCSVFTGSCDRPYPTGPDDFCSYGERRSDETD